MIFYYLFYDLSSIYIKKFNLYWEFVFEVLYMCVNTFICMLSHMHVKLFPS